MRLSSLWICSRPPLQLTSCIRILCARWMIPQLGSGTCWPDGFKDRDGKFVREFQTTYNSSFWELYLFAVLKELGIGVDFSFDAPDFVCPDHAMAIEAVIASHAQHDAPEWKKTIEGIVDKDTGAAYAQSIIRIANALTNKSEAFLKRYATLPKMQGRSYVVAVSNYGTQDFNMIGDVLMQWLLYDHFNLGRVQHTTMVPDYREGRWARLRRRFVRMRVPYFL